jgi:hypothetical protein
MRFVSNERMELQQTLMGIADAVRRPLEIDSLRLAMTAGGWQALLLGQASGPTSARAIVALNEAYGELPQRLPVDSIHLDELSYPDSSSTDAGTRVRFQISFGVAGNRRK